MGSTAPRDHAQMEVLTSDESLALAGSVPVGRVAFVADGGIQVFPVAHGVAGGKVVFKSAVGSKLDAAEMSRRVAFETDHWDPDTRFGWSVVIRGRARKVTDAIRVAAFDDLGIEPWLDSGEMDWIEISGEDVTGRRLP